MTFMTGASPSGPSISIVPSPNLALQAATGEFELKSFGPF